MKREASHEENGAHQSKKKARSKPNADLDALSGQGGARLDLPYAIPDGVQVETLGDLGGRGGRQQVLLVGEDEHRNAAQLLLIQQLRQLLEDTQTSGH